jgi:hypothetical protein
VYMVFWQRHKIQDMLFYPYIPKQSQTCFLRKWVQEVCGSQMASNQTSQEWHTPGPSAASSSYQLNFQVTTQALSDPQIPQQASVEKQLKKRSLQKKGAVSPDNFTILPSGRKRRCRLCIDAGPDGNDCPGSGNRSRCIYK